jgi:hypothetical protein
VLFGIGMISPGSALADPFNLILPQEAQLPPPREAPIATRNITRGPLVRMVAPGASPLSIDRPFWLRVEFVGRGGARIDPGSLRVRYLRAWEVDISERMRPFATPAALEIREAVVPPGRHILKIEIRDDGGRLGEATVEIMMH